MAAHGPREDKVARPLLAEDLAGGAGAVKGTVEINVHDAVPVLELVVQTRRARRLAGIGDHDVQLAKVLDDGVHDSRDLLRFDVLVFAVERDVSDSRDSSHLYLVKVGDVALVGTTLDLEIVLNGLGQLLRRGRELVPECDVGACLCQGSSHFVTNSSRAASDDGDFASHVKHLEDAVLQRRIGSTNGGHGAFVGEKGRLGCF
jgi:hypothetical protein